MGFLTDAKELNLTAADVAAGLEAIRRPVVGSGRLRSHANPDGGVTLGVNERPNTGGLTYIGRIVAPGSDGYDFADERYYVAVQTPVGGVDDTSNLLFSEDHSSDSPDVVVAHNLPEWADGGGTHSLPTDGSRYVRITAVEDHAGTTKWVMSEAVGPEVARFQASGSGAFAGSGSNYFLAKRYKADGSGTEGPDIPIRQRGAVQPGQDVIAIRPAGGVVDLAHDSTLFYNPPTTDAVPVQWEQVNSPQFVLCWLADPFTPDTAPAETSRGGWYDAIILPGQQVLPTGGTANVTDDHGGSGDQNCVFFNWVEQFWGNHYRGQGGRHAWGVIQGYTSGSPPKPIVYAVGMLSPREASASGGAAAWTRAGNYLGSDFQVLQDATLTINFAAQTFTFTKHFQSISWDSYGWIYSKTAAT